MESCHGANPKGMRDHYRYSNNFERPYLSITVEQLKSWLPVDAVIQDGRPSIVWMDFGDTRLMEPFFHQTVARVEAEKAERDTTDLDLVLQHTKTYEGIDPTGLIFHSSRCGSTTLSNACRELGGAIVISEAPVLDKVISRFFTDAPQGSPKELLYMVLVRSVAKALGKRRFGNERYLFLKFAATSTLQMSRIRQIFPKVPAVFMYRDPVEVIVSNLRSLPEWMNRNSNRDVAASIAGISETELDKLSDEEFCARAVGKFCDEAQANLDDELKLLNYNQLSLDNLLSVIKFFGVEVSDDDVDAIGKSSRLYSKDITGTQLFNTDTESKRKSASPLVIEMARQWAVPAYERLNRNQ